MPRKLSRTRTTAWVEGRLIARRVAVRLGEQVRRARVARRWSQRKLGEKIGLSASRISQIERGYGSGLPLISWFALGQALDLPLRIEYGRDRVDEPVDAGHLGMQELILRLGRQTERRRAFELSTRPADPALSVDVGLRDDVCRVLMLNACWNSFGNIDGSVRSTRRKIAEAEQLAVAIGGDQGPYRVAACWIVRDTRRNREIISRYPEVFASTFTGSSRRWVAAVTRPGIEPPDEPGLVWCDLSASRLFAWRR